MFDFFKKIAMVNSQIKEINGETLFFPFLMLWNPQGYLIKNNAQKKRAEELCVLLFVVSIPFIILFVSLSFVFKIVLVLFWFSLPYAVYLPFVRGLEKSTQKISIREIQMGTEQENLGRFKFIYGILFVGLGICAGVFIMMYQRFLLIDGADAPIFILFPLVFFIPGSLFGLYKLIQLNRLSGK